MRGRERDIYSEREILNEKYGERLYISRRKCEIDRRKRDERTKTREKRDKKKKKKERQTTTRH